MRKFPSIGTNHHGFLRFKTSAVQKINDDFNKEKYQRSLSKFEGSSNQALSRTQTKIRKIEFSNKLEISAKKRSFIVNLSSKFGDSTPQKRSKTQVVFKSNPANNLNETQGFILYAIAVMYLSDSFQMSLNICNQDIRTSVKSEIYQANVLRFKALNLE